MGSDILAPRAHTALLHTSTESVFSKCLTDVKCFGTPNINLVRGKSPPELCGWGQQCKVDSLTCLTSLSARFITNERMLLGQEKQSHGAWMGWLQIFTCTHSISHFVLSFGFWAWKTLYLSDRSSKTTVDCLKAMGNAFFASPTFFLPSSFYSIAPSCSSLSLLSPLIGASLYRSRNALTGSESGGAHLPHVPKKDYLVFFLRIY